MSDYGDLRLELENELWVLRATAEGAISVCNEYGGKNEDIAAGLNLQLNRVEELTDKLIEVMVKRIKSLESK